MPERELSMPERKPIVAATPMPTLMPERKPIVTATPMPTLMPEHKPIITATQGRQTQ